MKVSVFSVHQYDKVFLEQAKCHAKLDFTFDYHKESLSSNNVALCEGATAVCVFVNDILDADVLKSLKDRHVKAILLRCAGYNNVDLEAAEKLGLFVANVPSYSPESVAEYAVALIQTLNRKTCKAHDRVRLGDFTLDGLLGTAIHGKTVGIIGTGKIGMCFARIMNGFGCNLLAHDPYPNDEFLPFGKFVTLEYLLENSDVVSLHCPLVKGTRHLINSSTLSHMKAGAMLVNVARGGLIDTAAVIESLKRGHLGALALDVYEREGAVFYSDHSADIIEDDALMRLMTFPNVIITGHQAFFTEEALNEIATETVENISCFSRGLECKNYLLKGHFLARQGAKPVRM
jgi:D-lactate dehydrogenase